MPQTQSDEILKRLERMEGKIGRNGLSSMQLVLFSIGFGFLVSSVTAIFQSPKIFSLFTFILGTILVIWAVFLPWKRRKS